MNEEKKCCMGGYGNVNCGHCKPESPTPHATDWETKWLQKYGDVISEMNGKLIYDGETYEQIDFIRTTVDEAYERGREDEAKKDCEDMAQVLSGGCCKEAVQKERERTAKGIIKQIENLDLTGVNQVISLIHQIDKWMPKSAK